MTQADMVAHTLPNRDKELSELVDQAQAVIEHARHLGVDQSEVSATTHLGLSANVRLGEVETLEHSRDRGLGVTVYINGSKGHASSADLQQDSIRRCVEKAVDIARFTQADKCNGLAPAERLATWFPDLDLWHPRDLDVESAIQRALRCEAAGLETSGITNSEGASATAGMGLSVYANSKGFVGRSDGTRYGQSCVLVGGEGSSMQRDYWYDTQRAYGDLEAAEATGREAARRTVMRLGARKVKTCEVPVLFSPQVASGLIGHLLGAISGGALYRNASFLKDSAGQQLFPGWVNMSAKPHLPRGPASTAFDADGVATTERDIVHEGVLTGYLLGCYAARRLGLETTGNAGGVHNLLVTPGRCDAGSLLGQIETGLLVTEVMGQGVSLVTGDYSRGASGFWIEQGEIQYPVEEITIAGNLKDMFMQVEAIGTDVDRRSGIQTGSILIGNLTVAGT